jgi:hypothetical protein
MNTGNSSPLEEHPHDPAEYQQVVDELIRTATAPRENHTDSAVHGEAVRALMRLRTIWGGMRGVPKHFPQEFFIAEVVSGPGGVRFPVPVNFAPKAFEAVQTRFMESVGDFLDLVPLGCTGCSHGAREDGEIACHLTESVSQLLVQLVTHEPVLNVLDGVFLPLVTRVESEVTAFSEMAPRTLAAMTVNQRVSDAWHELVGRLATGQEGSIQGPYLAMLLLEAQLLRQHRGAAERLEMAWVRDIHDFVKTLADKTTSAVAAVGQLL